MDVPDPTRNLRRNGRGNADRHHLPNPPQPTPSRPEVLPSAKGYAEKKGGIILLAKGEADLEKMIESASLAKYR